MNHKISHTLKNYKKVRFWVILVAVLTLMFGIITALYMPPYTSELNFKEYSMLGEHRGSVVPASCVSGVHTSHPYDVNYNVTIDSGCVPVCASGEILVTTYTYRCFYSQVNLYSFTDWTSPSPGSCPAGIYVSTIGYSWSFPAGTIQQKENYSCVGIPSVNLNFQ